jgi:hypothetical protein
MVSVSFWVPKKSNCSDEVIKRVNEFKHWIKQQKEKVFVIFAHHSFLWSLTGVELKNCEIRKMEI